MSKAAFVTGGTGFIGSHLVEALLRRGYGEVRCLARGRLRWLEGVAGIDVVRADLSDPAPLEDAVRGVDYVYHVAGVTRAADEAAFAAGNVDATMNLLEAVSRANPGVRKVLVTSTLAVVGPTPDGIATEASPLRPVSGYGRSKAEMEQAVARRYGAGAPEDRRLPCVIIRPPAVYGPRDADVYTVFKGAARRVFPVVGRGDVPDLTLVHVRDLVRGMIDAAESEATTGETYCLGSERYYTWNEVKQATEAALGYRAVTIPVPPGLVMPVGAAVETVAGWFGLYPPLNREKAREIRRTAKMCAVDKAQRDFGYRQDVSLEDGIRETIAWYRAEGWL